MILHFIVQQKGCAAPERLHTPLCVKEKSECGNIGRSDGLAGQGAAVGVLRQSQLALAQQLDGLLVVSRVPVVAHELPVVVHVRLDGAALDGADVLAQQFADAAHIAAHVDLQQLGQARRPP